MLVPSVHQKAWSTGVSWTFEGGSDLSLGYELNPRTTLRGTGASTGTDLTSKVQLLMLGWQQRF
jgi:hypothetical protein